MNFTSPFVSLHSLKTVLSKLSESDLHNPTIGKWSVLQHLYHCWMVERGVLAYVKLKTQDPSALVTIKSITRLKFFFFFTTLKLRLLRINAPEVVQTFPSKMDIEDLLHRWNNTRTEADTFFSALDKQICSKGIFKHMFIGRMNKKMTQSFIQSHLKHHLRLCKLKLN